jgi:hypothetical protein
MEPMLLSVLQTRSEEFKREQRKSPIWFSELGFEKLEELNMDKSLVPAKPIEMPEEFKRFFDLPAMVGDEKLSDYYDFHSAIGEAVKPIDLIEWIWIDDFVRAEWDVRRNRRIKVDTIKLTEQELIDEAKNEAMMVSIRIEAVRARMLAKAEAENPGKPQKNKKEAKPEVVGPEVPKIKDPYLQAKAFRRCGDELDRIDRWISAGKKERDGALREIDRRRESMARRPEKASSEIIDAEFTEAAE